MLELTKKQVAALAELGAKRFVDRVRQDLTQGNPHLYGDASLASRLWIAFQAARDLGIQKDRNLVAFLRIEAYSPHFYSQPAPRTWLARAGRSGDERFEDYQRVMRWRIEHPEFARGLVNGSNSNSDIGSSSRGAWTRVVASWRRLIR
jgi:hypothetical protein